MRLAALFLILAGALGAETKEFVFRSTAQGELKIHVFLPPDWKAADKRPGILFFFGGGFTNGSPDQFFSKAEYLAKRGMVAASAEYRIMSKHGTLPDAALEDCREAMKWMRKKAAELGLDAKRLAASGGSAGGTCAAATAYGTDAAARPDALVLYNPSMESSKERVQARKEGLKAAEVDRLYEMLSPAHHVKKGDVPSVQFFGTEDALLAGAKKFVARSVALGNRAELFTAKGQKHGFFNDRKGQTAWHLATLAETDRFLVSLGWLKGTGTIVVPEGAVLVKERVEAGEATN